MAQPPRTGIPPAPPNDPNAGRNIHGLPNQRPDPDRDTGNERVNVQGRPPQPDMAPPANAPKGLGDNTKAEMEAGKTNLKQYDKRDDEEHAAGKNAIGRGDKDTNPQE